MTNHYYSHGGIAIYHGDCREILPEILPGLPVVDLVLTDPPYNISAMGGGGFGGHEFYQQGSEIGKMIDFDIEEYIDCLSGAADQIVAFHSRLQISDYARLFTERYGNYDLHVWYKPNAIPFTNNTWKSDIEYIALGWRKKKHVKVPQGEKSKVFIKPIDTNNLHPAQKPLGLMGKYINILGADVVLDPFMGSGTTLVAAKALGRNAVGIDKEEKYCEIAAKRLAQGVFDFDGSRV